MRIAYHYPNPQSIYANRTIYNGYKNAFEDLGHQFNTLTADDKLEEFLDKASPDIFITSSHFFYRKFLDYKLLKKYRDRGMKLFTKIDFWKSPISKSRINEALSMKDDTEAIRLIKEGLLGDIFFHVVEQDDLRMDGFAKSTGYQYYTIPLAADSTINNYSPNKKFRSDIAYVGTNLPDKRDFFQKQVYPLRQKYELKLYGQDWTSTDKILGWIQRFGQYFNIDFVKSIQKPKLDLKDEAAIYSSAKISINVHERYQRQYGGDCNERTFKIPLCSGFEITDDVSCISKYFKEDKEIVIAHNKDDWFDKIDYYMDRPELRKKISNAGMRNVMHNHTYQNRVEYMLNIIKSRK